MTTTIELPPLERLQRDIRLAAITLSHKEARFLVDAYYQIQDYRKASANQVRSMDTSPEPEPHAVLDWLYHTMDTLEGDIRKALDVYSDASMPGRWAKSIVGIGPVIAAGLLAHIDIERARHVGHIYGFAGLSVGQVWQRGQKRPWNAQLKTLCWKIGQSFNKLQNHPRDFYGHYLVQRKLYEVGRNERGETQEEAARILAAKKIGRDTEAYKAYSQGRLPPAHLEARAERWATKLFLSHFHAVLYWDRYETMPDLPYAIARLGHDGFIEIPHWPFEG